MWQPIGNLREVLPNTNVTFSNGSNVETVVVGDKSAGDRFTVTVNFEDIYSRVYYNGSDMGNTVSVETIEVDLENNTAILTMRANIDNFSLASIRFTFPEDSEHFSTAPTRLLQVVAI